MPVSTAQRLHKPLVRKIDSQLMELALEWVEYTKRGHLFPAEIPNLNRTQKSACLSQVPGPNNRAGHDTLG
jgi:hypothetical protein